MQISSPITSMWLLTLAFKEIRNKNFVILVPATELLSGNYLITQNTGFSGTRNDAYKKPEWDLKNKIFIHPCMGAC